MNEHKDSIAEATLACQKNAGRVSVDYKLNVSHLHTWLCKWVELCYYQ